MKLSVICGATLLILIFMGGCTSGVDGGQANTELIETVSRLEQEVEELWGENQRLQDQLLEIQKTQFPDEAEPERMAREYLDAVFNTGDCEKTVAFFLPDVQERLNKCDPDRYIYNELSGTQIGRFVSGRIDLVVVRPHIDGGFKRDINAQGEFIIERETNMGNLWDSWDRVRIVIDNIFGQWYIVDISGPWL